jgi:WD40 repeat protein
MARLFVKPLWWGRRCAIAVAAAALVVPWAGASRLRAAEPEIYLRVEPRGHTAPVTQVLFTPDGAHLISAGLDKTVRVWDVRTGFLVRTLRGQIAVGPEGMLYAAALSPDRSQPILAVGGYNFGQRDTFNFSAAASARRENAFRLIDFASGRVRHLAKGHGGVVTGLAFSPDGAVLASGSAGNYDRNKDNSVRLWDPRTGKEAKTLGKHAREVSALAFSRDGRHLASAGYDGAVRIWDVAKGGEEKALSCGAPIQCVAWSPDGALAAGSKDKTIRVWKAPLAGVAPETYRQADDPTCLAFTADGKFLLTGSGEHEDRKDRTVRAWTVGAPGGTPRLFSRHTGTVLSVAASPTEPLVASADLAGVIYLWDPATMTVRHRLAGAGASVFSVAWSDDGRRVAWGNDGENRRLEHWFDVSRNELGRVRPDDSWITRRTRLGERSLVRAADGRAVEIRGAGGRVLQRIGDADGRHWEPEDQVHGFTFTAQGQVIVGTGGTLAVYDVRGGTPRQERMFFGHTGSVLDVAVSGDGKHLVSGSADQTVRIWSLADKGRKVNDKTVVLPLESLFRNDQGEWIAWNESTGYYAASPAGDSIIGWHVNQGENRAAVFYSAFQFRYRLYRPDIVSALLSAGTVDAAIRAAAPARPAALRPPPVPVNTAATTAGHLIEKSPPPRIEIVAVEPLTAAAGGGATKRLVEVPEDGGVDERVAPLSVVSGGEITVRARVVPDTPDVSVRIQVEGRRPKRLVEVAAGDGSPGERVLKATLWSPGLNMVTVVAVNKEGAESRKSLPVFLSPPGTPGFPPVSDLAPVPSRADGRRVAGIAPVPPGTMYLLAIGVARFRNSPENNLRFTDDDARAFAGFYETQRRTMFKEVEVRSLTNEQATRDGIHKALGWLREKVRPDDQVVAYVSSHGFPGRKEGTFFFAPADFRADDLENTCVGWDRLLTELDALPCQRVVLVLDTCHSGGAVLQIVRGINPVNELLRNAREDGTFALVSSLPSEVSWVLPEHKQSAFTLAVLEGLRQGKAGSEPDGILTLERLFAYARLRVPELVYETYQEQQTPVLYSPLGAQDREVPIAKIR